MREYTDAEEYATIAGITPQQAQKLARAVPGLGSPQSLQEYGAISENVLHQQAGMPPRYGHGGFDIERAEPPAIWEQIMSQLMGFR